MTSAVSQQQRLGREQTNLVSGGGDFPMSRSRSASRTSLGSLLPPPARLPPVPPIPKHTVQQQQQQPRVTEGRENDDNFLQIRSTRPRSSSVPQWLDDLPPVPPIPEEYLTQTPAIPQPNYHENPMPQLDYHENPMPQLDYSENTMPQLISQENPMLQPENQENTMSQPDNHDNPMLQLDHHENPMAQLNSQENPMPQVNYHQIPCPGPPPNRPLPPLPPHARPAKSKSPAAARVQSSSVTGSGESTRPSSAATIRQEGKHSFPSLFPPLANSIPLITSLRLPQGPRAKPPVRLSQAAAVP